MGQGANGLVPENGLKKEKNNVSMDDFGRDHLAQSTRCGSY